MKSIKVDLEVLVRNDSIRFCEVMTLKVTVGKTWVMLCEQVEDIEVMMVSGWRHLLPIQLLSANFQETKG